MPIIIHVLIALAGIIWSIYLLAQPSRTKLQVSYSLLAGTLCSGMYLVVSGSGGLLHACVMGLAYSAGTGIVSFMANRKLEHAASH